MRAGEPLSARAPARCMFRQALFGHGLLERGLWAFGLLAILVTFARMFLGADFMDEAFYAAMAWRFVLGDTPFVDEINPVQTAALLTRPFVWLYTSLVGDTSGLLLALRMLWFAGNLGLVYLGWRVLRAHTSSALAFVIALFPLILVPIGLPAPSYNTCASGGFAAGLYLAILAKRGELVRFGWMGAGVCHALACIALPTYALPCVIFVLINLRGEARRAWLGYCVGGLIGVLPFVRDLARIGPQTLNYTAEYWERGRTWSEHVFEVLGQVWQVIPQPLWLGVALGLLVLAWRFSQRSRGLVTALAAVLVLLLCFADQRWATSVCFTSLVALIGCALVVAIQPEQELTRGLFWPAIAALFVAAWTSGNGLVNGAFGGWPAAMLTLFWLGRAAKNHWGALPALTGSALLILAQRQPYNEDLFTRFNERFTEGPFKGLWTSKDKRGYLDGLRGDLRACVDETKPILFAHQFPAGYLFTRSRPATHSSFGLLRVRYETPEEHYRRLLEDVEFRRVLGLQIVRVRWFQVQWDRRYEWPYTGGDEWIEAQERLVKRPAWAIYRVIR